MWSGHFEAYANLPMPGFHFVQFMLWLVSIGQCNKHTYSVVFDLDNLTGVKNLVLFLYLAKWMIMSRSQLENMLRLLPSLYQKSHVGACIYVCYFKWSLNEFVCFNNFKHIIFICLIFIHIFSILRSCLFSLFFHLSYLNFCSNLVLILSFLLSIFQT